MKKGTFQKTAPALLLAGILIFTSGCKTEPDASLATYKANMEQFFTNVNTIDQAINNLDPSADGAPEKLLEYLDALDMTVAQMAALDVPEGFTGVPEYAKDATDCMSKAVSYYHDAYEGEFNASYADAAYQYYVRANKDLKKIVKILHGEELKDGESSEDAEPLSLPDPGQQEKEEGSDESADPGTDGQDAPAPEGNWDDNNFEEEEY